MACRLVFYNFLFFYNTLYHDILSSSNNNTSLISIVKNIKRPSKLKEKNFDNNLAIKDTENFILEEEKLLRNNMEDFKFSSPSVYNTSDILKTKLSLSSTLSHNIYEPFHSTLDSMKKNKNKTIQKLSVVKSKIFSKNQNQFKHTLNRSNYVKDSNLKPMEKLKYKKFYNDKKISNLDINKKIEIESKNQIKKNDFSTKDTNNKYLDEYEKKKVKYKSIFNEKKNYINKTKKKNGSFFRHRNSVDECKCKLCTRSKTKQNSTDYSIRIKKNSYQGQDINKIRKENRLKKLKKSFRPTKLIDPYKNRTYEKNKLTLLPHP